MSTDAQQINRWRQIRLSVVLSADANSKIIPLTALSLAPAARDWLARTVTARVLNTFDRACNLINQDDTILALVTSERGLNPFAMVVSATNSAPFRDVSPASRVSIEGGSLVVGDLQIDLAAAQAWNPRPDWGAVRDYFAADPARLDEFAVIVHELSWDGSLLDLYLAPASGAPSPDAPFDYASLRSPMPAPQVQAGCGVRRGGWGVRQDTVLERTRRGGTDLVHGLLTASTGHCLAGAKTLAGLGGGLTPAGDDFIVGVLLAAWAGLYGPEAAQSGAFIAEAAAPLTTTLSAAYLRAAAKGECMAHWHALFEGMLHVDAAATRTAIKVLMSIGHTSGADALAGFLAIYHLSDQNNM